MLSSTDRSGISITENHIAYILNELEAEDSYSHEELYEWSEKYIEAREHPELFDEDDPREWLWSSRYATLRQNTRFFKNLAFLEDMRYDARSEEEWMINLNLRGVAQKIADFEICYAWSCPGRVFSFDWRELETGIENSYAYPPFSSEREMNAWNFLNDRYRKISENNLPICTVDFFLEIKL